MAKRDSIKLPKGPQVVGTAWDPANQQEEPIYFNRRNGHDANFSCVIHGEPLSGTDYRALRDLASEKLTAGGTYQWTTVILLDTRETGNGYGASYPLAFDSSIRKVEHARTANYVNLLRDTRDGEPKVYRCGDRHRPVPGYMGAEGYGPRGLVLPDTPGLFEALTALNEVMQRVRTAQKDLNEALIKGGGLDDPTVAAALTLHHLIGRALVGSPWENPAAREV